MHCNNTEDTLKKLQSIFSCFKTSSITPPASPCLKPITNKEPFVPAFSLSPETQQSCVYSNKKVKEDDTLLLRSTTIETDLERDGTFTTHKIFVKVNQLRDLWNLEGTDFCKGWLLIDKYCWGPCQHRVMYISYIGTAYTVICPAHLKDIQDSVQAGVALKLWNGDLSFEPMPNSVKAHFLPC